MRILVAEDDRISARLVKAVLSKRGHSVIVACDGDEALKLLVTGERIDIVVSDIMMPKVDGMTLLQKIKEDKRFEHIPVVLVSATLDEETVLAGLRLGAAGYIAKPLNVGMLTSKIDDLVREMPGSILVVDDELFLCDMLKKILEREGYSILIASSGEEALRIINENKVSLILSDIVMAPVNGLELMAEMKNQQISIPVLMMTGHGTHYDRDMVIEAGAAGYISKPFKNTEIVNRIQPLLVNE